MEELSLSGEEFYELIDSFKKTTLGCCLRFQCRGGSMAPFIKNKNIITVRPVAPLHSLETGDIAVVANHKNKKIVVHRIIKVAPYDCLLKGDNNKNVDGWFKRGDIFGVVEQIERQANRSYRPKRWQNKVIAYASRLNILLMAKFIFPIVRKK